MKKEYVGLHLRDFPFWLRALFALTLILFFINALYFIAFSAAGFAAALRTGWRVDPGTATLFGSIVGLAIIGWQARLGFNNLVRSQDNQARLEREARLHQHQLELETAAQEQEQERIVLVAALRAEMSLLKDRALAVHSNVSTMREFFAKSTGGHGLKKTLKHVSQQITKVPIFEANISKLGLLGASLAADVVSVLSEIGSYSDNIGIDDILENVDDEKTLEDIYKAHMMALDDWVSDLGHVENRLWAAQFGAPDLASLSSVRARRHAQQMHEALAPLIETMKKMKKIPEVTSHDENNTSPQNS